MKNKTKQNVVRFALTIISKDRPGIVADTTEVLYRLGCNIEDSSCTMLGGDFAIILIVSHEKPFSASVLKDAFREMHDRTGITVQLRLLHDDEITASDNGRELCVISVYGSDKPGIVYKVTRAIADMKINITDLNTRLVGTEEEPVYVLMLEAVLLPKVSLDDVSKLLEKLKKELEVEIGVRIITPVAL
ncbi:MAG: ACT domain-containing protein [Desulfuromonadales bacterium]|nr:ACT domain-containing protein [Desulfuromonadales bacterium]